MWELWQWNGHYSRGRKVTRFKTEQAVFEYVKKNVAYHKIARGSRPSEYFLENEVGLAVAMIINSREIK